MLTGTHPFRGEGPLQTLQRIAEAAPTPIQTVATNISDQFAGLVTTMLARTPQQRPAALQVAEQLVALQSQASNSTVNRRADLSRGSDLPPRHSADWQPSLLVLPFQSLGGDGDLQPIAAGLVENLTIVLSRVPMLSLTSRMSSFALKEVSSTANEVRRQFDVDYIIEGSLQRYGDHIRANVMLIETERGFQLWAQQFDCPDDSYAVSSLLRAILSRLEPQLIRAIFNELRGENSELSSRQLVIQSMSVLSVKGWHKDSFQEVAALLRKSIELEPDFAFSHAYLALILGLSKRVGLVSDSDQAAREAVVHADLALDLEEMDSNVLGLAGCALADVGQTSRAIPILRNAIDINPNNAQAHAALGAAHLEDREHKKAIEHLKTGIELSPLDGRLAVWYSILATAYLQAGESDQALDAAQKGCLAARMTYLPRVVLSAVYAQRGEQVKALAAMEESLRVKPDLSQNEIDRLVGPRLGKSLRKLREQITTDD